RLELAVAGDGVNLGFGFDGPDGRGGENRSGGLDRSAAWKLSDLLESFVHAGSDDDEESGGRAIRNSVATYANPDPEATATGFAELAEHGDGTASLELLSNHAKLRLTKPEARQLADALYRTGAARRLQTEFGPLGLYLTDDDKFGFRMYDEADELT